MVVITSEQEGNEASHGQWRNTKRGVATTFRRIVGQKG